MHFSLFLTSRSRGPEEDRPVMKAMVEHAKDAEQRGFDAVFLPDHHFTGYAPPASDPFVFAAYLAGQLERMHFGFSVQTLALHHPVRFAERLALLDQLTDGKLLVGVGSGTTPEEMIGFGVNFQDSSRLANENLEIAEKLWAKKPEDEPVTFDNGHYRGAVVSRIVPAPYTKPEPRVMSVAARPSSVERAAKNAQPAFILAFTPPVIDGGNAYEEVRKNFATYRTALEAADHSEEKVRAALEWTTHSYQHVHIAETDEQAAAEMDVILQQYQEAVEREHEANKAAEAISGVDLRPAPDARTEGYKGTWCLYGSPETVAAELQKYADLGIGNVLLGLMGGPLTEERKRFTEQSMRLFSERVLPLLRASKGAVEAEKVTAL
ncbi:LLM class flavin-dependent oxidoreductase [Pseudarthrobacter sp. lyk4-40-TYG-27]|uniref:LLM class flavin-dependent oxidoreductase n=1 Tax=Pseudarthrobacter sp. lyk4-40-TYG-27 TaxID=3040305 RepID=UPI00255258E5|nr:LLM class flavin-dependent oxidoreductase [Pseudarthrobacter sp. lyk4-40-TYG-27]